MSSGKSIPWTEYEKWDKFEGGDRMVEYPKIETVYVRDTKGSKKLIEGLFRSKEVEYLRNNKWVCTEKIDGTNIGVVWDGHNVSFQGRTEKAKIPSPLLAKLEELFGGNENEELFEQLFGEKQVIIFGEGYGPKIQKVGNLYRDDVSFIVFDILINGFWLQRGNILPIARTFGVDTVPVVLEGTLDEAVAYVKSRPMSFKGNAPMEGLVCKPEVELRARDGSRIIVKVKVMDF